MLIRWKWLPRTPAQFAANVSAQVEALYNPGAKQPT